MAKPKRSSTRQTSVRARSSRQSNGVDASLSSTSGLPEAIVWGLLLARWLVPTEGTAEGDTLWLTSLTLAAAAGFCWLMSRVSFERFRFEKLDVAVWLLCGAHILSALIVIVTEGNKRASTNMLWEWLGIAVMFSLIRQTITSYSRTKFLRTMLVVTTALACYGIWQPTFWYPSNLREYQELRAELESVESSSDLPLQQRIKRQRELHAEFVSQGIPLSGPQRQLFEKRLADSTEPLGFFALTNTFSGFMAMTLVLLAGTLLNWLLPAATDDEAKPVGRFRWAPVAVVASAFLLVAYCLFLTKSRSAWGGSLVGLVTLIFLLVVRSKSRAVLKRMLPIVIIGAVALSLLAGVAIVTGALDVEVLSEASVSLRYRMEYWTSTWDVIVDHPLFGTGPGNFRDNYLRHKLPQASEEIADPHQFVLDVAANAGVIGLLGLATFLTILGWLAWPLCRPHGDTAAAELAHDLASEEGSKASSRSAIFVAGIVIVAGEWLFSGRVSWHVCSICLLAVGLDFLLSAVLSRSKAVSDSSSARLKIPALTVVAATVAIFVHLSAAGGIAMPAVAGVVLALAAVLTVDSAALFPSVIEDTSTTESNRSSNRSSRPKPTAIDEFPSNGSWLGAALFGGLAAVGCAMTAFSPVIQSSSLVQQADYEAVTGQPVRRVISLYTSAAKADTLSPEPYIRMSQYYLHQWKQTRDPEHFDRSIENAGKARALSPNSPQITHDIGYAWLVRATVASPKNETAIMSAVDELQNALEMYPTHPTWTAETAQAFALAGEPDKAAETASRALVLDGLNRNAGHVDRYLPDELLVEVKRIANSK